MFIRLFFGCVVFLLASVRLDAGDLKQYRKDLVSAVKTQNKDWLGRIVSEAESADIQSEDLAFFYLSLNGVADKMFVWNTIRYWFKKSIHDTFVVEVAKLVLPPAAHDEIWFYLDSGNVEGFSSDSINDYWPSDGESSIQEKSEIETLDLSFECDAMCELMNRSRLE